MLLQNDSIGVALFTNATLVSLLWLMLKTVQIQVPLCDKGLATRLKRTHVRLLPRMHAHMDFEISALGKPFGTNDALKRFFTLMSVYMNFESIASLIVFSAYWAYERFLTGVDHVMSFEIASGYK